VMMRLDHEEGGVRGLAKVARDATDERAAEEALRHAHDEMEQRVLERTQDLLATNNELQRTIAERQQLEKELLEISEREKRRIGQDLHDIVCQELSATALFLKSSANKMERKSPAIAKMLNEAAITVNRNVTHARDLARGFQPVELSGGEFTAAMRALVTQTNSNRLVRCHLDMPRPIQLRDETIALNLYRIAQEALFIAIKHSETREVVVSLTRDRRQIRLIVEDSGKGFRANKRTKGLGLHIMKYRASVLGGSFILESKPKHGTRIICTVPVKPPSKK
jgi:signal transduction histidine kinase